MNETGVDVQALALTAPRLHNLEDGSVVLAQRINDIVAAMVTTWPDRFQGLGVLPISVPHDAPREL